MRKADAEDRSTIKIPLTAKAEGLQQELLQLYHQKNRMFLSWLSTKERLVFGEVVKKLETAEFSSTKWMFKCEAASGK